MGLGDAVFGEVNINYAAGLKHKLPYQIVRDALVEVADVDGGFFVLLPDCQCQLEERIAVIAAYQCLALDMLDEQKGC